MSILPTFLTVFRIFRPLTPINTLLLFQIRNQRLILPLGTFSLYRENFSQLIIILKVYSNYIDLLLKFSLHIDTTHMSLFLLSRLYFKGVGKKSVYYIFYSNYIKYIRINFSFNNKKVMKKVKKKTIKKLKNKLKQFLVLKYIL